MDEINDIFFSKIDFSNEVALSDVLETLKNRPKDLDIILTGRGAPKELIDYADIVTDMKCVKHCYDSGTPGKKGIEF
ncbi:hypothetical protein SDC9_205530 [bioreactor metagenome]|uniref:Cob(I)yrinic acid a,c-diamide adenosyltransferase n=1 Tax=bioreactor metagenome TaxID=1076179 RepID=A0A645J320_9ZZZZ